MGRNLLSCVPLLWIHKPPCLSLWLILPDFSDVSLLADLVSTLGSHHRLDQIGVGLRLVLGSELTLLGIVLVFI